MIIDDDPDFREALSAVLEHDLPGHAAALAVAGYLEKPIELDDLLATVRRSASAPDRSD